MKFDYDKMPRIKCENCNREYIQYGGLREPYVCYSCRKEEEHKKEKKFILSTDCDPDYEPFSTDDGYYCPYCGEYIDIDDDYELYSDGTHSVNCPWCKKNFEVETCVSHSFTSRRIEDEQ